MPSFPTHTLFSYVGAEALKNNGHPLWRAIENEKYLFMQAATIGADIQLMPYYICNYCQEPTRFATYDFNRDMNSNTATDLNNKTCPICNKGFFTPFRSLIDNYGYINRMLIEKRYYRNTHLVLGEYHGYGVHPKTSPGPSLQPFPRQVVDKLINVWKDILHLGNDDGNQDKRFAYMCGWFAHVISDALFKGIYPNTCSIKFYDRQYDAIMLPASEALAYFIAEEEYSINLIEWWTEIPKDISADDVFMSILGVDELNNALKDIRKINTKYLVTMYAHPEYSINVCPSEDSFLLSEYRSQKYGPKKQSLEEIYEYSKKNGWYNTLTKGVEIYSRLMIEAWNTINMND